MSAVPEPLPHFSDPFRELSDALDMGVLMVDEHLVIQEWNAWLDAATGKPAQLAVGRPLSELFPSLAGGPAEQAFRRAVNGEAVVLSQRLHGYLLPLRCESVPGFELMQQTARIHPVLRDGRPAGAVAMIQDVTERVAREEELRAALARAEAASEAKSAFLATTSHELRTPLTAVIGYSQLIETDIAGPTTAKQREFLGRIKFSTWHLISLIDEILTFSRVEAGKEDLDLEDFDLAGLARQTIVLIEPQALQKDLQISCAPDSPVPITADRRKVRQILLNLLGNAVKFTDCGGIDVIIEAGPQQVLCRVRDTGIGIKPGDLERVFEPFTQANQKRSRERGGTGLGLAVSRRLAELMGGDIAVESTPGRGSVFTLRLPRSVVERAPGDRDG